jgi:RNA recognition motif-containing protein
MTTIYVGNLPFSATEQEVRAVFEAHGEVRSVSLVSDRETGRPSGFGFVEMPDEVAEAAIVALNGQPLNGRPLRVNPAQQRQRMGGGPFRR